MTVMWLATSNDRKLTPTVFGLSGLGDEQLRADADMAYGAAIFAAGGEVLSLKRPVAPGTRFEAHITSELRTTRVLAQAEPLDGDSFRPQDTPPFRYKGWVCGLIGDRPPADTGPLSEYELDLLTRNVRGNTSRERLGFTLLARLYASGLAKRRVVDPSATRDLIVGAVEPLHSDDFARYAIVLSCEDLAVICARGIPVSYCTVKGAARGRWNQYDGPSNAHLRASFAVCGRAVEKRGWSVLAEGATLVIGDLPPARTI